MSSKTVETLPEATVLFAGDSGDGMQLTGTQFTLATAHAMNDLATLPDFPAESVPLSARPMVFPDSSSTLDRLISGHLETKSTCWSP